MKKCLLSLVAAGVLFAISGTTWAADPKAQANAGQQKPAELDRTIKVTMKYLIYLPKDYDQKDSWPVMLFLHGSGERGDNLDLVKKHGPPKLIGAGKQFPFIVVSPQCPNGQSWEPFKLAALLDEIAEKYKVDQDRIYLTGLSMGGFGTWALAAHHAESVRRHRARSVAAVIRPGRGESPTFPPGCSTVAKTRPCRSKIRRKWSRP